MDKRWHWQDIMYCYVFRALRQTQAKAKRPKISTMIEQPCFSQHQITCTLIQTKTFGRFLCSTTIPPYQNNKLENVSLPGANIDLYDIIKVELTPFLDIIRESRTEHSTTDVFRVASLVDGGKLAIRNHQLYQQIHMLD